MKFEAGLRARLLPFHDRIRSWDYVGASSSGLPRKPTGEYRGQCSPLDVLHAGGSILDLSSDAYFTLHTWMENGATENGLKPATPARTGTGECNKAVPPGFNAAMYTSNANFGKF